jgi:hypothetical protein
MEGADVSAANSMGSSEEAMKVNARRTISRGAAGLVISALIACAAAGMAARAADEPGMDTPRAAAMKKTASPQAIIRTWPKLARATARAVIAKYGPPQQFDRDSLVWFHNGAWKRTIVHRRTPSSQGRESGCLEQTIGYMVPEGKVDDLRRFYSSIEVSQTAGELSVRSMSERRNYLILNLADEIVSGKRSVAKAREMFAKTSRLQMAGKSSPYLDMLQFEVDNDRVMIPTGGDM